VNLPQVLADSRELDLEGLGPSPRIAIVVRDHMSGVLYSVPSLRAIRRRWPAATITLLTSSYSAPILSGGCPYLDRVLPLYTFADEPRRFDRARDLIRKARTWATLVGRVDLVIHLRSVGGGTVAFATSLGRPKQVGYSQGRLDELLTRNLGPQNNVIGSRQRNRVILDAIGIESAGEEMELWISDADRRWARDWLVKAGHDLDSHLTVVHPGSHWGCNQWLPERWSETIDRLLDDKGGTVVITGVERERPLADRISAGVGSDRGKVVIATGATTLPRFAALIECSDLVLAIDASPTQICQALGVPAVVMMGAGNPAWNGPLPGEPMLMLQEWDNDNPRPELCQWSAGACNGPLCSSRLEDISVDQVLASAEQLLVPGAPSADR
jgi:ADP-heptose:LPS heptosyltransferase